MTESGPLLCCGAPGSELMRKLFDASHRSWFYRIKNSSLPTDDKRRVIQLVHSIVVNLVRNKPDNPLSFLVETVSEKLAIDWVIPPCYDYRKDTAAVYASSDHKVYGQYAEIRKKLDFIYHGNYSKERQLMQDVLIESVVESGATQEHPWLIYSAGAMGAGKSHCVRWMSERGYFPFDQLVRIDADKFREMLPEWEGYLEADLLSAGARTRREAGYCVEIAQEAALQANKNTWVDGSLRNESWYAAEFDRILKEYPKYRITIIHVFADLELVKQRAHARGMSTGRFVPDEEIEDSFKKVPSVVRSLTPRAAFVAHIDNNGPVPRLADFCVHGSCQVNPSGAWHEISRRFSSCPRLRSEAIAVTG
ncbi:hypothetical protein DIPPA_00440 [Diplonema papillatum]|nr:hypothetical protein DIPPA_00440 [Diplonema papillatum]